MSVKRQVTFSSPLPTRKSRPESHPLDSGVGSSSSEHTASSGSLEETFTAWDYDIQSNNVDALREALLHAIKDAARWKEKFHQEQADNSQKHKAQRDAMLHYRKQCDEHKEIDSRKEKTIHEANARINALELELSQYKRQYTDLHERYQVAVNSTNSMRSGVAGEHSHGSKAHLDNDSPGFTRLKERLNRDQDTGSLNASSKTSRSNSENTTSSKRTAAPAISKPYIEKIPPKSTHSNLVSPREHGTYNLTTTVNGSSSRRLSISGTSSMSRRNERGDYMAHPLPDRK